MVQQGRFVLIDFGLTPADHDPKNGFALLIESDTAMKKPQPVPDSVIVAHWMRYALGISPSEWESIQQQLNELSPKESPYKAGQGT